MVVNTTVFPRIPTDLLRLADIIYSVILPAIIAIRIDLYIRTALELSGAP